MMVGVSVSQLEKMVFLDKSSGSLESGIPEEIETRFGKVTLHRDKMVSFPRGLLGMPEKRNFQVSEFPSDKLRRFKLLQCCDDYALSFITFPIGLENGIIAAEDLLRASTELGIQPDNLAVLLIASVHRSPEKVTISVNARAPLLIDASLRLAAQYVFQTDKYKVQHYITA
ncbi:MAG TPA: flagellar assembly protein FliW [Rickettsiales bacterium]|nr:flagellar assembly protein FliW [Rickettsiales bacterium]